MAERPIWALDIGETSIKAVKMRLRGGVAEILEVDMIDFERNLLDDNSDEEDRNLVIRQALQELVRRRNLSGFDIATAIPGRLTISKTVELPPTEKSKIPEMVRFEVQNVIPFPIEEIIWDHVVVPNAGGAGTKIEVNLLATKKESVYSFLSNFQAAKLDVNILQTAPLALFNLVKVDQFPDENVVVVDIGAQTTDLVIIHGDRYWVRNVPKAGHRLTEAIQQKFDVSFEEAERLKIEASTPSQMRQVAEAVRPVLRDLVGEISRTIGFYKSQAKEADFDRILFLGNTIRVGGFKKFMSSSLPYKVDYLSSLRGIRVSNKIRLEVFKANLPSFGIAIGLGLQALGLAPNQISLMPKERAEVRKRIVKRSLALAGVLCIGIAVFLSREGIRQRNAVAQETANFVKNKTAVKNARDQRKEILVPKVIAEGLAEPKRDRAILEQASQQINRLLQECKRKQIDVVLSESAFERAIEERQRKAVKKRKEKELKYFIPKLKATFFLAVPGKDAQETRKIVSDMFIGEKKGLITKDEEGRPCPRLGESALTLRQKDGVALVELPAAPEKMQGKEVVKVYDPYKPKPLDGAEKVKPKAGQTGYFLWKITWELKPSQRTAAQILYPEEETP